VPRAAARQLRAFVTPGGRVVLAWENADVREDEPVRLHAGIAVRERGGRWRSFRLGGGTAVLESFPDAAPAIPFGAGGATWVAWTGIRHGLPAVRVARVRPGGLGAARLVSGRHGEAELEDAVVSRCGTPAFTYTAQGATWAVLGAGAPQRLGEGLPDSRVAWDPQHGEAIVVRGVVTPEGTGDLAADVSPPAPCP
jgi:hypothetical protein